MRLRAIGWVSLAAAGIVFPLAVLAAYDVSGSASPEPFQAGFGGIAASVDIAPDTLNPGRQGNFVTAYIELPKGWDVAEIDMDSVQLCLDEDCTNAEEHPTAVGDEDQDGIPDRMVKFSRQAVIALLGGRMGDLTFRVKGEVSASTFEGTNTIRVLDSQGDAEDSEPALPEEGSGEAAGEEPPSAPPMRAVEYEVRLGDTLTDIAARFGTTREALTQLNGLEDPNAILYGSTLSVPDVGGEPGGAAAGVSPQYSRTSVPRGGQ
ncbi:MAG: LysM peptidoglycan-binding domain-containing protein [Dehalococcoidia bacterium]|nr:LysM peptidoglycan-binding domain-containing protein [Dehalococcoidia bacterium]